MTPMLDAVHLARDGVQQVLPGGQPRHRVGQAGLVQLQVFQAQRGHARQHRRQRAHRARGHPARHEHAKLLALVQQGHQQLALLRQPQRFRAAGGAGKIQAVRLEGQHAGHGVAQTVFESDQVAPIELDEMFGACGTARGGSPDGGLGGGLGGTARSARSARSGGHGGAGGGRLLHGHGLYRLSALLERHADVPAAWSAMAGAGWRSARRAGGG